MEQPLFFREPKPLFHRLIYEACFNTDKKVGEKVNTIDKAQFCDLIRTHQTAMYRYALGVLRNPADAEDAVGEAILKAYTRLGQLKNPDCFKAWVMAILTNETRTMLSRQKRLDLSEDMSKYGQIAAGSDKEIWYLVMELPDEFRDAVILYYYDRFRIKEIACMLHVSEGTVKSRLSRAREKLKKGLEEG